MTRVSRLIAGLVLLLTSSLAHAQEFFNLTAQEVRIDSLLPLFSHTFELGTDYADSVYTVSIDYPEFIDMSESDIARYQQITDKPLPTLPEVQQYVGVSRKRGTLYMSFVPLVFRDGKFQKLVSFMLKVQATGLPRTPNLSRTSNLEPRTSTRYASHSVLATGRWAKIRIPETGVYQLTSDLVRKAGFTDVNKVKIYGYGGAMQPERLTADYLVETDDLQEVPTCNVGGRRLFYAKGPVGWSSKTTPSRTRNPYSNSGYYFLTENDSTALTVDEEDFKATNYPSPDDYHSLYEVDDYAWYHGGRNLYDSRLFGVGVQRSFQLEAAPGAKGSLYVVLTYDGPFTADVLLNGNALGTVSVTSSPDRYSKAAVISKTFTLADSLLADNQVTISQTSGKNVRLDYLSLQFDAPKAWPDLTAATIPMPEYVYNITNQDHHADTFADMIIVIPTSQQLLGQARRLQEYHESHDSLRVRIVPADELFNEFSSGTPDANAYRRYLKMLYDRADSEADMPRYLLLFGDGAWDNRMLTTAWKNYSPDDFLLCYESENSFSETDCYVSDDYFCLLDDNEGGNMLTSDKGDVAVGRLSARSETEAKAMVDKTLGYLQNEYAGAWRNTLCFMGDDGDSNRHMDDADAVATMVSASHPDFNVKKIYWDAYARVSSATGFSYPDVTRLIRQQMEQGALIMNYSGHGAAYTLSHEQVVHLDDFSQSSQQRLPLWLTASCDIMPFDGQEENIGETAMYNPAGGAVAFYGTTRTVYAHYNGYMNRAFTRYVLGIDDEGRRYSIGEAARLAKNLLMTAKNDIGIDQTANKLQFTLLGDPALVLAAPTMQVVVDSIDGQPADGEHPVTLRAGQAVSVAGHIVGAPDFKGMVTLTVKDVEQEITCRQNDATSAADPFTYKDRPVTLYTGSDSISNGRFNIRFALPKDISNTEEGTGLITLYALSTDKRQEAHGAFTNCSLSSGEASVSDGIGPNIYCYLNSSSFTNGDDVNTTPMFHAELYDKDGINVSGAGIGHDVELLIDGKQSYVLNDYFQYDFGDYRSGSLSFVLPELTVGPHRLLLRAWDVLNNSSTAELQFNVVRSLQPTIFSVGCTKNPASTSTTFYVSHDRAGSQVEVQIDVFDTSGRQLWCHKGMGVSAGQVYTVDWDLTTSGGHRLLTGVYIYRVTISSDGSGQASQAKKLIIVRNK